MPKKQRKARTKEMEGEVNVTGTNERPEPSSGTRRRATRDQGEEAQSKEIDGRELREDAEADGNDEALKRTTMKMGREGKNKERKVPLRWRKTCNTIRTQREDEERLAVAPREGREPTGEKMKKRILTRQDTSKRRKKSSLVHRGVASTAEERPNGTGQLQ